MVKMTQKAVLIDMFLRNCHFSIIVDRINYATTIRGLDYYNNLRVFLLMKAYIF